MTLKIHNLCTLWALNNKYNYIFDTNRFNIHNIYRTIIGLSAYSQVMVIECVYCFRVVNCLFRICTKATVPLKYNVTLAHAYTNHHWHAR